MQDSNLKMYCFSLSLPFFDKLTLAARKHLIRLHSVIFQEIIIWFIIIPFKKSKSSLQNLYVYTHTPFIFPNSVWTFF